MKKLLAMALLIALGTSSVASYAKTITVYASCMGCSVSDFSINTPSGVWADTSSKNTVHLSSLGTSPIPSGNYSYSLKLGSRYCSGSFYLDNSKSYITLDFLKKVVKHLV